MTAVVLMAFTACTPIDDPKQLTKGVVVSTTDPTYITGTTASCGSAVTADDAGLLLELGVCWSLSEKPTVDNNVMKSHKCSQPYVCLLTNLEPNTVYHVRGYAKYGTEYCYGDEKTFTTLDNSVPAASPVTTKPAYDITYNDFWCDIVVEPFGVSNWYTGVCYSQNPDFTIDDCEGYSFDSYFEDDVYHAYCSGMMPNTQYYYRAFVRYFDAYGTAHYFYGKVLSLTTHEIPFILNLDTYDAYYSGIDYIVAYGRVECYQPELINQVGFCYSTANEYPQYESDLHTTVATPTGEWYEFSSHIFNISANNKYYIRSYARYKTDSIKYGNVVSVDTY